MSDKCKYRIRTTNKNVKNTEENIKLIKAAMEHVVEYSKVHITWGLPSY